MKPKRHTLISAAELEPHVGRKSIVLIDARGGENAKEAYAAKHIKGARYVDLNRELSSIKSDLSNGGRHPLPTPRAFGKTLGKLGITPDSRVVVYDDKGGANAAARFWWMMRSIGHRRVQVLNGGLQAAEREGIPVNGDETVFEPTDPYPSTEWQWPIFNMTNVRTTLKKRQTGFKSFEEQAEWAVIFDVRESGRYKGQTEPIDLIAGSIPQAINEPYTNNLDERGMMLPLEKILERYEEMFTDNYTAVYCGSGVTACHFILALESARLERPTLYVGGWSEYSRNPNKVTVGIEESFSEDRQKISLLVSSYQIPKKNHRIPEPLKSGI